MKKVTVNGEKGSNPWFKQGSLYVSCDGTIVLCIDSTNSSCFSGTVIHSVHYSIGFTTDNWASNSFTKFSGTITLED